MLLFPVNFYAILLSLMFVAIMPLKFFNNMLLEHVIMGRGEVEEEEEEEERRGGGEWGEQGGAV